MTEEILTGEPTDEQRDMHGEEPQEEHGIDWYEANRRYLAATLSALRIGLESALASGTCLDTAFKDEVLSCPWGFSRPPAVEQLCASFQLSSFEQCVLLLAAGAEMDPAFPALYASLHPNRSALPTLGLALTSLPHAHWTALHPAHALRRWELIELRAADTLVSSTFRMNERILHYLAGVSHLDERLQHVVRPLPPPEWLPFSFAETARQVAAVWVEATKHPAESGAPAQLPVIELCGSEPEANRIIASHAAATLNLRLHVLSSRRLAQSSAEETERLLRLWEREAILSGNALLLETAEMPTAEAESVLSHLIESIHTPIVLSGRQPQSAFHRPRVIFYTGKPTRAEQADIWRSSLEDANLEATIDTLVAQFNLAPIAIRSAAHRARPAGERQSEFGSESPLQGRDARLVAELWDACRVEARPHLEGLAQRIEPAAGWNDLVLPDKQNQQLRQIAVHVRQKTRVYETWGFAARSARGLGISALFAGPSGTGKTTAAEVLARDLCLDLFRIDLSQVVSKYIGETEKNLGRLFDAAEQGAAVLLFDEADALFGKRTEIKDSHDRYANVEVSYLLQRMEAYRGLAILTTNRKSSLDQAFLRRIRFVVEFPFPEAAERAEMWRRIFPARMPVAELNIDRLARLRVSGGNIHNIAMGAAFLAADAEQPVCMSHLLTAARSEFAKLETPINEAEVAGWL